MLHESLPESTILSRRKFGMKVLCKLRIGFMEEEGVIERRESKRNAKEVEGGGSNRKQ